MMGDSALVVSVKNRIVVTALDKSQMRVMCYQHRQQLSFKQFTGLDLLEEALKRRPIDALQTKLKKIKNRRHHIECYISNVYRG
jgi:hypothetical protein